MAVGRAKTVTVAEMRKIWHKRGGGAHVLGGYRSMGTLIGRSSKTRRRKRGGKRLL